jgi:hypothetical protein
MVFSAKKQVTTFSGGSMKTMFRVIAAAAAILVLSTAALAADSGPSTVSLSAKLNPVLSVSVSSGSMDFGTLDPTAINVGPSVTITTKWVLGNAETHVRLYSYFTGASALTSTATTGSQPIPFSAVQAKANAGSYTGFTAGGPYSATQSFLIHDYLVSTSAANNMKTPASDTLNLQIDMTNLTVPADNYSGTMYIQAQAN